MRGSGGTEGGVGKFFIGLSLAIGAIYFLFDSVTVTTRASGLVSGWVRGIGGMGDAWDTSSFGIVFVPFFLGVIALFYDARPRWAWALMWSGLGILVIEILSRIRFLMHMKLTYLALILVMGAAGVGLMLRSYRDEGKKNEPDVG